MTPAELMAKGKELDFPAVRIKPGQLLNAGESNWKLYLKGRVGLYRRCEMLSDALWMGDAQGPGCVGIVR